MSFLTELWLEYVWTMLWQSTIVMVAIWSLYALSSKRSAAFRYALLCLVLIKFLFPTSLHSVTGLGHWLGSLDRYPAQQITPTASTKETPDLKYGGQEPLASTWTSASPLTESLSPQSLETRTHLPSILMSLWLTGVLFLTVLLLVHAIRIQKRFSKATPVADPVIFELLEDCRKKMGVSQRIPLYELDRLSSPVLAGLFRPQILISQDTLERLSETHLRPIFLHELAHAKRRDLWVNTLQVVLQVLWFFHPGLWLTNWLLRRERERACDDLVLAKMDGAGRDYADSILRVLKDNTSPRFASVGLLGIAERESSMKGRIQRILDSKRKLRVRVGLAGIFALLTLAAVLLPMAKGAPPSEDSGGKGSDQPQVISESSASTGVDLSDPKSVWRKVLEVNHSWLLPDPKQLAYTLHMGDSESTDGSELLNKVWISGDKVRWEMSGEMKHPATDSDTFDYAMVQNGTEQYFYRPKELSDRGLLPAGPPWRFKQGVTFKTGIHLFAEQGLPDNTTIAASTGEQGTNQVVLESILSQDRATFGLGLGNVYYGKCDYRLKSVRVHLKVPEFVPILEEDFSPEGKIADISFGPEFFNRGDGHAPKQVTFRLLSEPQTMDMILKMNFQNLGGTCPLCQHP